MRDIFHLCIQPVSKLRWCDAITPYIQDDPDTILSRNLYLPANRISSMTCMTLSGTGYTQVRWQNAWTERWTWLTKYTECGRKRTKVDMNMNHEHQRHCGGMRKQVQKGVKKIDCWSLSLRLGSICQKSKNVCISSHARSLQTKSQIILSPRVHPACPPCLACPPPSHQ